MAETIALNCLGMRCPRPIIELAKAARRSAPGSVLRVEADDLAFPSDVRAWCESTGARLVQLEQEGGRCIAEIALPE